MEYGFTPAQLLERMRSVLIDESIVWLSIEDAKVWGCNCIYYTLRVEPHLPSAAMVFEFIPSVERLVPIAVVALLPRNVEISKLSALSKEFPLYVFGGGDVQGVIIPLSEDGVPNFVAYVLKRLAKEISGVENLEIVVDGYYVDLLRY